MQTKKAVLRETNLKTGHGSGMPYDVPDFRKEEDRVKFENDNEENLKTNTTVLT